MKQENNNPIEGQNKRTIIDGGITEQQINGWKAVHRRVAAIDVTDGEETHRGYFHRPNMETMAAVNKLGKTDEVKAAEVLFSNCWLGGSAVMQQDAVIKMEATGKLGVLMGGLTSEIKNL